MFFTIEKIESQLKDIQKTIHRGVSDIPAFKYMEADFPNDCEGAQYPEFDDRGWGELKVGDTWGGYDRVAWFRTRVSVPEHFKGRKLALRFLVGPRDGGGSTAETLLYVNGSPVQGIDIWHEESWLPPDLARQDSLFLALKAWSGVLEVPERRRFKLAQLVWIDEGAECFFYSMTALVKSIKLLDENDLRRAKLLHIANQAMHSIDYLKPRSETYYRSLAEAAHFLSEGLARLEIREIKPQVTTLGHSHIDMAWLWRLAHSREKAVRTFSTVLHLMRKYPEYRFMHSSPQLYKYLKEDYPDVYEQVKERIAEGRWEVTGGMWVEADTNLTSGESLVRQFLLGRRFVREEFGVEMNTLWLPDVFGYSGALPQIIRKSGARYFLTTKISWSQFNRFPYDTFQWRGIDGTEVLTHFVTTPENNTWYYTYNGRLEPSEVKGIWDNYQQKGINDELLLLFGWGDGGGGPTKEMLESARALKNLPGIPEVKMGKAEPYFERLEQRISGEDVPVWDGELYLEFHRGTYTSQAYNKRANRKSELLFHDSEWMNALAGVLLEIDDYPANELRKGWELILVNQFHDVLPGSSIRQVYEDCHKDYAEIARIGKRALSQAQNNVLSQIETSQESVVAFNSLSWARSGLVELPWSQSLEQAGCAQVTGSGGEKRVLLSIDRVPSMGYRAYPLAAQAATPGKTVQPGLAVSPQVMENAFYRIELNRQGQITSLWDKRSSRQALSNGKAGNVFQAFEDKPMNFDAWDIDIFYQEKMREIVDLVEAVVEESGPLRGTLRLSWRFGDSTITQKMCIYQHSPRIDFKTEVDWREQQVLLKAAFPVNVRATRATYDIQFGSLERPTHWNTSWDYARFEAVGHKWVDLSEGNYGVSLLNDCKYGHDVKDNVMRLTLIKSAIAPDAGADKCQHTFTYSLLPHTGDWRSGGVVQEAYDLNCPLLAATLPAAQKGSLPGEFSFARTDADHVIIETVKKAEEGEAWIVRVYEYKQCRSSAVHLQFGRPIRQAAECNLVEEEDQPAAFDEDTIIFGINPFEIKTFKVWF